ncbi:MAG TPA: alpha/beta fold hydrolase [Anaerolineales bacterium]|nr:alpha/beta fold hydrolase [Anaerolineales bacterium]
MRLHPIANLLATKQVVFLHGFMGSALDWQGVIQHLPVNFGYWAVDLPGHATQPLPHTPQSLTLWAHALQREIAQHLQKPFILVGYSMGGRLALTFAGLYPHLVTGLVLESTSPGMIAPTERQQRAQLDAQRAEQLEQTGWDGWLEQWYAAPLWGNLREQPYLLAPLLQARANTAATNMARVIRELSPGLEPEQWSKLAGLTMPTLLIAGQTDAAYCNLLAQMARQIPHSQTAQIPDAGHNTHLQQPAHWAKIVSLWLMAHFAKENCNCSG